MPNCTAVGRLARIAGGGRPTTAGASSNTDRDAPTLEIATDEQSNSTGGPESEPVQQHSTAGPKTKLNQAVAQLDPRPSRTGKLRSQGRCRGWWPMRFDCSSQQCERNDLSGRSPNRCPIWKPTRVPSPYTSSDALFAQLLKQLSVAPVDESEADRASRLIKLSI